MSNSVPKEINGVYEFNSGKGIYKFRIKNTKKYTNEEFMNIYKMSSANRMYYGEPCTIYNDPDGNLHSFPRNMKNDKLFLQNVLIILEKTKIEEKKQLINNILNECFIVDKEPELKEGIKLSDANLNFTNSNNRGKYHIDQFKLKDIYRDAINCVAHKYIKKYNHDGHYNKTEEKNIDLLLNED